MRKGFTLVEIMMVISILAILMTITMRFGSNRINDLKYQNIKEQFISAYERIYSDNMTSNYNNGNRYEILNVELKENGNQIFYSFDYWDSKIANIQWDFSITWMLINWEKKNNAILTMEPYNIWCSINELTWSNINLDILVEENKRYCFEIKSDTCKLIEKLCPLTQ